MSGIAFCCAPVVCAAVIKPPNSSMNSRRLIQRPRRRLGWRVRRRVTVIVDPVVGFPTEINPKLRPFLDPSSRLSGCGGAAICAKLIGLFEGLLPVGRGAMPTYIVGDIQITDLAPYQAHIPRALASI